MIFFEWKMQFFFSRESFSDDENDCQFNSSNDNHKKKINKKKNQFLLIQ